MKTFRYIWVGLLALLLSTPVRSAPSKTEARVLLEGTPWETPYYIQATGVEGPTVLITGGIHGNEPAGAFAAEQIRHWPITKGRLVVIPRCNVPALAKNVRRIPDVARKVGDLNRNFPIPGKRPKPVMEPAITIWNLACKFKPDYVLDLHEGYGVRSKGSKSVGSSVIGFPHPKTKMFRDTMLKAVNADVRDDKLRFVPLKGSVSGMLAGAAFSEWKACAFICETTFKDFDLSLRIRWHRIMVHAFLKKLGMTDVPAWTILPGPSATDQRIRVAIYDGGSAGSPTRFLNVLASKEYLARPIHPFDIHEGALEPFDVVLFPGGSGSGQAKALDENGRKQVQEYIRKGGGYIGVCAGAYLATSHYSWSLGLLNAASLDTKHWRRGKGTVKMAFTHTGQKMFQRENANTVDIRFAQGPILGPGGKPDLPTYEVLGWYRTGVGIKGADPETMVNTPAIIRAEYGDGRAVAFSPHPEQTDGLHDFILHAVEWCASR